MTSTPDENPTADQPADGSSSGDGAEIGIGEPSTFEPEEDPEAAD